MKKLAVLLLVLTFTLSLSAQDFKQTIRGNVRDVATKLPLFSVYVKVTKGDFVKNTTTDIDGNFRIDNLPIGRYDLEFTALSYESYVLNQQELTSSKELILQIEMTEKVTETGKIVFVSKKRKQKTNNKMVSVSGRTFSIEESQRYAGSRGDVARMAQNFAGVQGSDDSRNDIIVRGNSPMGVLYRLEGVDIPSPNHYSAAGTTGGPVSMLNNNVLSNSDFLSGAFPAEYGNANAAVFDIGFRKGNNEKTEFLGQIGFAGFEGMIEGPISKKTKSSYLVNYRYSALGVFALMGIDFGTGTAIPQYQDLTFHLHFPDKNGYFKLFGLGGISEIELLQSKDPAGDNLFGDDSEDLSYKTRTGMMGLSRFHRINKKSFIKFTAAIDASSTKTVLDTFRFGQNNSIEDFAGKFRDDSYQGKYSANVLYQNKLNSRNVFKAGARYYSYFFSLRDSVYVHEQNVTTNQPLGWIEPTNFKGNTGLLQTYASHSHRLTKRTKITLGVNSAYYTFNQAMSIEPRIGATFKTGKKNSLSVGYGLHSQLPPFRVFFEEVVDSFGVQRKINQDVGFTKSHHFVIANDYSFNKTTRLKVELYYQQLFDVPIDAKDETYYSLLNQGADFGIGITDSMVNRGKGRNYGVEITLEKFLSKGFYYLNTLSLYRSFFTDQNGTEHPTAFDSRYAFNSLFGKEFFFKKKETNQSSLTIDTKLVWNGGKRYTPVDEVESQKQNEEVLDESNIFSEQFDDYLRFDLRIGFKRNGKKTTQEWGVDIQNLTNRNNIFTRSYDVQKNEYTTAYQTGLLPIAFYRITF